MNEPCGCVPDDTYLCWLCGAILPPEQAEEFTRWERLSFLRYVRVTYTKCLQGCIPVEDHERNLVRRACCGTPPTRGHRGTCPNSLMMGGNGL